MNEKLMCVSLNRLRLESGISYLSDGSSRSKMVCNGTSSIFSIALVASPLRRDGSNSCSRCLDGKCSCIYSRPLVASPLQRDGSNSCSRYLDGKCSCIFSRPLVVAPLRHDGNCSCIFSRPLVVAPLRRDGNCSYIFSRPLVVAPQCDGATLMGVQLQLVVAPQCDDATLMQQRQLRQQYQFLLHQQIELARQRLPKWLRLSSFQINNYKDIDKLLPINQNNFQFKKD